MKYQLTWDYSDVKAGCAPVDLNCFDVHFSFTLRFPEIPRGEGHTARFCFNVLSPAAAQNLGMLVTQRGHVVVNFFSFEKITEEVERTVENAFASRSHKEALALLNSHYIDMRLDFSEKFKSDLRPRDCIIEMIRCAFDGVPRGQGITLHEAEVLDDYGTEEDRENARRQDNEERWQDIPQKSLSLFTYWMYLDYEALRYYLPAVMISLLESAESGEYDNDASQSVLPLVDPRDVGRGHGEDFDVEGLIKKCAFTPKQVEAIYFFLINAAIEGGVGVEEDYYPAILKWRMQALGPA